MTASGYLFDLAELLAAALDAAAPPERERHVAFVAGCQAPDGGFPGREGASDLYYTSFALRALDVLRALDEDVARRAAGFLRARLGSSASIVDFVSLLYSARLLELRHGIDVFDAAPDDWAMATAEALESFRRPDGGYGKTAANIGTDASAASASSTYHTFLVALCHEMIGGSIPDPEACVRFLLSRRREDGGFVEVAPMRRSGTNPTAAAVTLLTLLHACDEETAAGAADFLAALQSAEGGLCANTRVPLGDLLSTFTGLLTLVGLGAADRLDLNAMRRYVESLTCPGGGFRGGLWDCDTDAEYTFYGLGTLALLELCSHA
jgi:geranylgeranyl transferase type-2 subunit beta